MPKSDLPFGSEFSPSQIDLPKVLEFAKTHGGDWKAFEAAVRKEYFESHKTTDDYNRAKLANNTKLGMIAYGLIDREAKLTAFGEHLVTIRRDDKALYTAFGRQVLLNLHGTTLVQCVQDMHAAGETVELVKLRQWLGERGVHFPRGGKHASIMRLWLEKAGVFPAGWRVDEGRFKEVLGITAQEVEILSQFTFEQRAYLKALANMAGPGPYASNDVEKLAAATYGIRSQEKGLAKNVLQPLEQAGYISVARGTTGRGAKHSMIMPTPKLAKDLVEPLLKQLEQQTDAKLRAQLRKPFEIIVKELSAANRHVRGLALEALAFKLMRLIDMDYVATRLRGTATGGAEVDVIFQSTRLVFSRWQIQCKNTGRIALDDVAKEVGLATHFLKSNVIVMVSTGEIGPEARRFANKTMSDSNLCVVMMDRKDITQIVKNPASIVDIFNREAQHAMRIKVLDLQH